MQHALNFLKTARFRWWRLTDRYLWPSVPRSAKPYTTHLPALLALRFLRPVRRVLELGAGEHSTLAFLDRECFPDLEALLSLEHDPQWAERVKSLAGNDSRLSLQVKTGAMAQAAAEQPLSRFDLIFIDDSLTIEDRSRTIATIAALRPQTAVAIIHDFEVLEYRYAALGFRRRYRFTGLNPGVGIVWNRGHLPTGMLRKLNSGLHHISHSSPPADRRAWLAWLRQHLPELFDSATEPLAPTPA